jgi:(2R)-ethylmalonyl-CoA mutase
MVERSTPWVMRTYSGHSNAVKSNELYRDNLAKGQTGLSIAFDLPTQTGYDPDDPEASGEVGKVGVPIAHLGHMRQLLADIPLGEMNTSMTINATAPWLWGLYLALADEQGVDLARLQGTTQNDIVKEYLSRGTYIFAPEPSKRLIVDMIAFAINNVAKWNPINVCSYHLQEAGATPVQEIAYALATAIDVLDAVRDSGKIEPGQMPRVVGRMSFFVNAGVRFIEEIAKVRTFTAMWDEICRTRYGVQDPSLRRFRYGVQVNSLGLTEQQPENNVQRIVLEMLGVTLSADARARAIQLPAWNEALGLPRPWDQQWSLRVQQVLAFESDLLEYPDIFAGSRVMDAKVRELTLGARGELDDVLALGGAFRAIDELKSRLVASQSERVARIESGEQTVVGVNRFIETAPSPLTGDTTIEPVMTVDPEVERELVADVTAWRRQRDESLVLAALDELARVARSAEPRDNIMVPTIALAKAGGTTGVRAGVASRGELFAELVERSKAVRASRGTPPKLLVAKPGLDGHSNGAEQIAVAARDAGFEVVYQGIRSSPEEIVAAARDEDVDIVGVSILSGSHLALVPRVVEGLRAAGVEAKVVVGGIVPDADAELLRSQGVAAVYTPKDYSLAAIMSDLLAMVETAS